MATASLNAQLRADRGKGVARKLRAAGQIPGVIYGHGREPQSLTIDAREFNRLAERIRITSTVIELALDGKTARTLVRELQRDPIKRSVLHVDFQELVAGETVNVSVPLRFIGVPDGVRVSGGILEEVVHHIHLECDPSLIPDHVDVDVTALTIGHSVHVSDLKLPEGVQVTDDPELTLAVVSAPKTEAEPVPAEGAVAVEGAPEPELIRKAKEDEDEDKES
ncbi:MAG: 50S ribosomal protein L25/general stress protein Ctc [Gemmatimonadaceae bacterium]